MRKLLFLSCAIIMSAVMIGCGGGGGSSSPSTGVIPTTSQLVGAWRSTNTGDKTLTVFMDDGSYVLISPDAVNNNSVDNGNARGYESGTYAINTNTGVLTPTLAENYDGDYGLLNVGTITALLNGTNLSLTFGNGGTNAAAKVTSSTSSAIVGAWRSTILDTVMVFLSDGTFYGVIYNATDGTQGVEYGTYTWNPSTGVIALSLTVDSNGADCGYSRIDPNTTMTVSGNQLTAIGFVVYNRIGITD